MEDLRRYILSGIFFFRFFQQPTTGLLINKLMHWELRIYFGNRGTLMWNQRRHENLELERNHPLLQSTQTRLLITTYIIPGDIQYIAWDKA